MKIFRSTFLLSADKRCMCAKNRTTHQHPFPRNTPRQRFPACDCRTFSPLFVRSDLQPTWSFQTRYDCCLKQKEYGLA